VDDTGDRADRAGRLDEGVHRVPGGHVDGRGAHLEAGVEENAGGSIGIFRAQVGQQDVFACAHPAGDRLADRSSSDDDDHGAHG